MHAIYISVVRGRQVYKRTSTFEEGRITSCDSLSSFKKVEAVSQLSQSHFSAGRSCTHAYTVCPGPALDVDPK